MTAAVSLVRDPASPGKPSGQTSGEHSGETPDQTIVRCRGLEIGYRGHALLPPFDLDLRKGTICLVVGRNGSGKTTFVRTLLGLLRPVRGTIEGHDGLRRAYVPQVSSVDSQVPVRSGDVVGWGRLRGWSFLKPWKQPGDDAAVARALDDVDARTFAQRRFGELSGGQQQRVLLARMLASEAELALLDEPTSAMDRVSERSAYQKLRALVQERGLAAVIVTHAVAVAAPFADAIAFFDPDDPEHGAGRVHAGPAREIAALDRFEDLFGRVHVAGEEGSPDVRA